MPDARQHSAGDQPVADLGIEILRLRAQAVQMQRRALDHRDGESRRPGAMRLRDRHRLANAERRGHGIHGGESFR